MSDSQLLWHNNVTMEYLELYKNEPILWNPKHPQYKNKVDVNEAWLRIQLGMSVELTVTDLKKKKESLMTTFRMQFKKKLRDKRHKISWFAYDLMESFLGPIYGAGFVDESINTSDHQYHQNTSTPKPKITIRHPNIKSEIHYVKPNSTVDSLELSRDMDECELYGRLLAKKMRRLNEHQRDLAMHEIDNIMFRAKMNSDSSAQPQSSFNNSSKKSKSPLFILTQPTEDQQQYEEENVYLEDPMQD